MRGFISGAVWGLIVAATGLSVASLMGEQPAGNTPPETPQVDAPEGAADVPAPLGAAPVVDTTPATPAASPTVGAAPQAPSSANGEPSAGLTDTAPAPQPEATALDGTMDPPAPVPAPVTGIGADDPVLPNPQSLAPQVPVREGDIILSTDPAQPTPPQVADPEPVVIVEEPAEPAPDVAAPDEAGVAPEVAAPEAALPEIAMIEVPQAEPAVAGPDTDDPGTDDPEIAEPEIAVIEVPLADPSGPDATAPETPARQPETADEPAAPARITLRGDDAALPQIDSGVRVNRPETETTPDTAPETAPETADDLPDAAPALQRFAAAFDNPDGLPLMAVVLLDDGEIAAAAAVVASIPFPVTVALDPGQSGAADRMAAYRAAGIEVLALARLPEGAQPSDVEVSLEAVFRVLPEAIGLIDLGAGGLQATGPVADQAMDRLAADGRGLVALSAGLNPALRSADTAGVPVVTIYRDLDAEDQDARVIRRFVDQAAFRARQESGVVLLGRVRPDTLSALILWGTANRAGQVALVPVSAVLLAQ